MPKNQLELKRIFETILILSYSIQTQIFYQKNQLSKDEKIFVDDCVWQYKPFSDPLDGIDFHLPEATELSHSLTIFTQ